jgi:ABC-type Fe3+-citrate transport system substrate-binding protein
MKKLKLMTAIIAILLFSNVLFAGNPNTETSDDISNTMVESTHNDVTLTSSQKEILKKKANEYAVNLLQARAMSDKDESYVFMKTVTDNYQAALDSLLTPDQKVLKEKKIKERIDALVAKVNSNN